jgi:hypothetical protein
LDGWISEGGVQPDSCTRALLSLKDGGVAKTERVILLSSFTHEVKAEMELSILPAQLSSPEDLEDSLLHLPFLNGSLTEPTELQGLSVGLPELNQIRLERTERLNLEHASWTRILSLATISGMFILGIALVWSACASIRPCLKARRPRQGQILPTEENLPPPPPFLLVSGHGEWGTISWKRGF